MIWNLECSEGTTKGLRSSNPIDPVGQDVSECFNKVGYVKSRGSFDKITDWL